MLINEYRNDSFCCDDGDGDDVDNDDDDDDDDDGK